MENAANQDPREDEVNQAHLARRVDEDKLEHLDPKDNRDLKANVVNKDSADSKANEEKVVRQDHQDHVESQVSNQTLLNNYFRNRSSVSNCA